MINVLIRYATIQDYVMIEKLMEQLHLEHYENKPDIYKDVELIIPEVEYKSIISDKNSFILVSLINEIIIGMCWVSIKDKEDTKTTHKRLVAWMEALVVEKSYRNKGIGKALFKEAEKEVKGRNIKILELQVWDFNKNAMNFYSYMEMRSRCVILEKKVN